MEKESRYETTVKRLIGHNLNAEEKVQLYNDWSSTFETNNKQFGYTGNSKCCDVVCKYFPKNREHIVMLDVGAGTGLLAEELASKGFKIIDGLDPSSGMLKEAEKKKTYRNLFCSYFTSKPLLFSNPVTLDSYDLLAVVGSFVTGHIPYDAIIEMIRITKPGGIICIVNRRSPFYESPDYEDKFFPLCDRLEKEGKWKKEEITTFNGFIENADGIIIVYRVR
ncbi:methyltransferase-like protein 27 [Mytilus trossulus]|uniref:methyltransferase-like protein 27 n=1 Tax=Mytilus trossulus TaxID=6551 RepID=UPI0030055B7D